MNDKTDEVASRGAGAVGQDGPDARARIAELEAENAALRWALARAGDAARAHSATAEAEARHGRDIAADMADNAALRRAEEALRASEARLSAIVGQAAVGIGETDLSGRFLLANDRHCAILGRPREELLAGLRMQDVTHPDDLPRNMVLFRRMLETGEPFSIEKRYLRPDGSAVWTSSHVSLTRDGEGQPRSVVAVVQDVTDRVRAEAALAEERARLDAIIDHLPVGVGITDGEGRVVLGNPALRRFVGRTVPSADPRAAGGWVGHHPDGRRIEPRDFVAARALRGETVFPGVEFLFHAEDGSRCWTRVAAAPVPDPAGSGPSGAVLLVEDIHDRKAAEEALRERTRRLRLLADIAAGFLAATDPDEVLGPVFRVLSEEFGLDISFSYVADEERGGLRLASCFGVAEKGRAGLEWLAPGEGVCGHVAQARRAMHVAEVQASERPEAAIVRGLGVRAYAAFPLLAGDRLLGTLSFGSRRRDRFPEEDLAFLATIAQHVAAVRERLRAEAALRAEGTRLHLALEAGRLGIWELDVATDAARCSPRHDTIFGYRAPPPDWGYGRFTEHHVLPEDRDHVDRSFRTAVEGGADWHFECRIRRADDGEVRWIEARGQPVRDAEGRPVRLLGVVADVTDRKRAEERQALLLAELSHRVKNSLAVVQSLAAQTARGAADLPSFAAAFQARLIALARAHDLLTRRNWEGAALDAVVRAALEPLAAGAARVDLSGCASGTLLAPAAALALAMALHELATNATKYGALSVPGGRVSIACAADPGEGSHLVEWTESGGPPVPGPPTRRGFGLRLLGRGLATGTGMAADLRFEPDGVRCMLRLPPQSGVLGGRTG